MKRMTTTVVALAFLAGCATMSPKQEGPFASPWHGKSYSEVKKNAPLAPDKARVYLFRKEGPFLWKQSEDILVDGVKVGVSVDRSFLFVDVAPGSHTISTPSKRDGLTLPLGAGEERFLKGYWIGANFNFSLETKEEAEEEALPLLSYRDQP